MKKEQIFETAEKRFFAKRYTDVKLDNIANSLNIRKPSLYYYFTDKKDLFLQTLKYSMNKYIRALQGIIQEDDLDKFLEWYLAFPANNKNLFAIAYQKWHCTDEEISYSIYKWKQKVDEIIDAFLSKYESTKIKRYLIKNLLEKLTRDNCTEKYCLKYKLEEIVPHIKHFIQK